jgi:hypothetical protein
MTDLTQTIVINCSKEVGTAIREEIDSLPGSKSTIQERKNLDGITAGWVVIATLATQSLPHILSFIAKYIRPGNVTKIKIKIGDREIEIENPTPAQVELLLQQVNEDEKST